MYTRGIYRSRYSTKVFVQFFSVFPQTFSLKNAESWDSRFIVIVRWMKMFMKYYLLLFQSCCPGCILWMKFLYLACSGCTLTFYFVNRDVCSLSCQHVWMKLSSLGFSRSGKSLRMLTGVVFRLSLRSEADGQVQVNFNLKEKKLCGSQFDWYVLCQYSVFCISVPNQKKHFCLFFVCSWVKTSKTEFRLWKTKTIQWNAG